MLLNAAEILKECHINNQCLILQFCSTDTSLIAHYEFSIGMLLSTISATLSD